MPLRWLNLIVFPNILLDFADSRIMPQEQLLIVLFSMELLNPRNLSSVCGNSSCEIK